MKVIDCEHGSPEWMQARLGIPTGSCVDNIMTPKTRKLSASSVQYRNKLLAEWLTGFPMENGSTLWMDRGMDLEPKAREWYEFHHDAEVAATGFVLRDDGLFGGSPDGLIGDDGGVEFKCPAIHTHIGYMLKDGPDYIGQVQSYLYLTEREWWDVVSYNPDLPAVVNRVHRDEEYIASLVAVLDIFVADLAEQKEKLLPYRMVEGGTVAHPVDDQIRRSLAAI